MKGGQDNDVFQTFLIMLQIHGLIHESSKHPATFPVDFLV